MKKMLFRGSFLIELMIVVAVIAFLAVLAVPNLTRFLAKAKRAEVYMNLSSLYAAEKSYWAEYGTYSSQLIGEKGVGWQPEGYSGGGQKERFYYTYGFLGQEGKNYFTGKLETSLSSLASSQANKDSFVAIAIGDINRNGKPDIITINDRNEITIVFDALQ